MMNHLYTTLATETASRQSKRLLGMVDQPQKGEWRTDVVVVMKIHGYIKLSIKLSLD